MLKKYHKIYIGAACLFTAFQVQANSGQICSHHEELDLPYDGHLLFSKSIDASQLQLEDCSVWTIAPNDVEIVDGWKANDRIRIYPNTTFFKSTPYILYNQTTGDTVEAEIKEAPKVAMQSTKQLLGIDVYTGEIIVEDQLGRRTLWKVATKQSHNLQAWRVNDMVIIGHLPSSLFFSSEERTILINVDKDSYVQANIEGDLP